MTFPEALKSEEEKLGLPSGVSQPRVPARGQWGRTEQREEGGTHPPRRGRAACRSDPSRTPRQGDKARGGLPGSSALGSGGAKENRGSPGRVGAHATLTMVGGGEGGDIGRRQLASRAAQPRKQRPNLTGARAAGQGRTDLQGQGHIVPHCGDDTWLCPQLTKPELGPEPGHNADLPLKLPGLKQTVCRPRPWMRAEFVVPGLGSPRAASLTLACLSL